jgi:TonB-dependent receptor
MLYLGTLSFARHRSQKLSRNHTIPIKGTSMSHSPIRRFVRQQALRTLLAASTAGLLPLSMVQAADAVPPPADSELSEVLVSGFRLSLQQSADAKRESVSFSDSIFAEDIGKFPDSNIAESFNRIPGITIVRETSGEGLNIAIRGLGTSFTRILLNDAPVAVASTGRTDSQNTNREVDLDMFPTELFTQLTVSKSPTAAELEGGAAGVVNMRSARAFDREGFNLRYSLQGVDNSVASGTGIRGSLLASNTFGESFGVLAGVAFAQNKSRVRGFETIGWTNANLSATQCSGTCNSTGGGNWTIPGTVPANAGNGLTTGAAIDQAFLLAHNPGLTIQQIDNAIIPRLGRPSDEFGDRNRYSAILSAEYRPSEDLHFYVDSMYGRKENDLERIDLNWVGRNGAAIPLNMTVDRSDCSTGCVVTGGTFANAQMFLEYRPFIETTDFYGVNPGMSWQISERLSADLQANYTNSTFHRESPTVLPITPGSSGITVNYDNTGSIPLISSNIDLNDASRFGWAGGRVNMQDEERETETKGARFNLTWGDDDLNIRGGAAYDDVSRSITAFDNSQAWQNAVCGNNPSQFLPGPNTQPGCRGLVTPGTTPVSPDPTYPGYGTGFSAGFPALTWRGSLISNAALPSYMAPGPSGFVTLDWDRFAADSHYDEFHDARPEAGSSNTGANGGFVREKVTGGYVELNGAFDALDHPLRYNIGVRYVHTDQTIGGRVSFADPRNTPALPATPLADGARFPNVVNFVYTEATYDNWLPSLNLAYNVADNAVLRLALSETMTRANPNSMLPGLNFSSPSADTGSVGNPEVAPYLSRNIDLGFEIYTGGPGYISLAAFRKEITGFTINGNVTVPFTALDVYGVNYNTLTPTQQAAINSRGGPNAATVVLTQQVNAPGELTVNGIEAGWVQPLDFALGRFGLDGFGFSANMTLIDQKGSGAAPAVALGVAPTTYNFTAWYENHGVSARISHTFAEGSQVSGTNQNGIALAAIYGDDYRQWDFSSSWDLGALFGWDSTWVPELTLDVVNFTNERQRAYFQFENAAFTQYQSGRTIIFGVRGAF